MKSQDLWLSTDPTDPTNQSGTLSLFAVISKNGNNIFFHRFVRLPAYSNENRLEYPLGPQHLPIDPFTFISLTNQRSPLIISTEFALQESITYPVHGRLTQWPLTHWGPPGAWLPSFVPLLAAS